MGPAFSHEATEQLEVCGSFLPCSGLSSPMPCLALAFSELFFLCYPVGHRPTPRKQFHLGRVRVLSA